MYEQDNPIKFPYSTDMPSKSQPTSDSEPYCPIDFFDDESTKDQPTIDSGLICPVDDESTHPNDEESFTKDYKPSFCHGPDSKDFSSSTPHNGEPPQYVAQVPRPAPYSTPAPFNLTIPLPLPKKEKSHILSREPRFTSPKAYDIAMELMAAQPLRMVDNALYAYDGQVYRFVSAPTMNRLIMHLCRTHVHAVGDASIIKKIYEIIQAEPSICMPPVNGVPLVAFDDGLLDLTTLEIGPFSPNPFVTVKLCGSYTKGATATCPIFNAFLSNVTGGDPVLTERIW